MEVAEGEDPRDMDVDVVVPVAPGDDGYTPVPDDTGHGVELDTGALQEFRQ